MSIETSPHPVVQDAFQKFEQLIWPSDARLFKQTTLEDVRKAALIISEDQSQRQCLRNLNKIKPLFDVLNSLSGPLETLCQGTPYLCYIWAPIKLILQIADEYNNSFTRIMDAYVEIAQHLPRLDRLSDTFSHQADFRSILADIYSDILEFHSNAYRFLRRSSWKIFFDSSWTTFGSRFNAILKRLEKGRDLIDREASSFDILESKDYRQRILEDLVKRERERYEWQLRDSLLWLDLKAQDREQEELVERRIASREPRTCGWILNHPKVQSWLEDDDCKPFLWLNGKPGSGKTTLATFLVEQASFPPDSVVLYCLCSYGFGKVERNACSLAIRSLIAQIIRLRKDLVPYLYDSYVKIGAVPSLPKTEVLLADLLRACENAYLVIDGLDECEPYHQKQLLARLFNLVDQMDDDNKNNKIRILICSRDNHDISSQLNKTPKLSLSEQHDNVTRDIEIYTIRQLNELKTAFDDATIAYIQDEIVHKAKGMFLWVQLVIASLSVQGSIKDVCETVNRLPADLSGVYKAILDRICQSGNKNQQRRVQIILGILTCCLRPLKVWEICDFVVFQEGADDLNDRNKLAQNALEICKPFIEEVDGSSVQLVHFSAREFLLEPATDSEPYLQWQAIHLETAVACVKYLLTCHYFFQEKQTPKIHGFVIKGFYDLFPYVHEFWTIHMVKSLSGSSIRTIKPAMLHRLRNSLSSLTRLMTPSDSASLPTVLHVSSEVPEELYVQNLRDLGIDLDPTMEEYISKRLKLLRKPSRIAADAEEDSGHTYSNSCLLTSAYICFTSTFQSILSGQHGSLLEMGILQEDLQAFKLRHEVSAFMCRWTGCVWASAGFRSKEELLRHELSHSRQYHCPYQGCDDTFASARALRNHKKYHTTVDDVILPTFPESNSKRTASSHSQTEWPSKLETTSPELTATLAGYSQADLHPASTDAQRPREQQVQSPIIQQQLRPITDQDIQRVRQANSKAQNMTDDQLRAVMIRMRDQRAAQNMQKTKLQQPEVLQQDRSELQQPDQQLESHDQHASMETLTKPWPPESPQTMNWLHPNEAQNQTQQSLQQPIVDEGNLPRNSPNQQELDFMDQQQIHPQILRQMQPILASQNAYVPQFENWLMFKKWLVQNPMAKLTMPTALSMQASQFQHILRMRQQQNMTTLQQQFPNWATLQQQAQYMASPQQQAQYMASPQQQAQGF